MKKTFLITLLLGLSLGPAPVAAQVSDLLPPQKRAETVDLAAALLQTKELPPVTDDTPSPFAPPAFEQPDPEELRARQAAAAAAAAAGVVSRPAGDRAILEDVSAHIIPTGIVRLGGESILLFGQKKLKVGDRLTITFEGANYDLDITAIGTTTFTLRYNREEITRSIKPGKTP